MAYNFTAASSQRLSTTSTPVDSGPVTIAAWVYPTAANTVSVAAIDQSTGSNRFGISLLSNTFSFGGVNYFRGAAAQSQSILALTQEQYTVDQWNHIAGSFDYNSGAGRSVWMNGINARNNAATENTSGKNRILIGARTASGTIGAYFSGRIAEVGIWNVELAAEEIASLAKGMTCDKVRPQSLVFYAPLVRDLIDAKGGLTITNNNTATVANHPRVYA
jgi:hypothetical protein